MNFNELKQALPAILKSKLTPFLIGPNGIGKTEFVRQFALSNGFDSVRELRLGVMADVGDLKGIPYKQEDASGHTIFRFARPDWMPTTGKHIIFLDEVNRARHELQQGIFEMIREHRIGEHQLPEGCVVIAAGNPNSDAFDTIELEDDAYKDRFAFINVAPSLKEWVDYSKGTGMPLDMLVFFETNPMFLERAGKGGVDYSTIKPSRRSVSDLSLIYKSYLEANLDLTVFREVAHGIIGIESTEAFLADLQKNKLPGKELVTNFAKHRERLEQAVKDGRTDLVSASMNEVVHYLEDLTDKLPPEYIDNLIEVFKALPVDLRMATYTKLAETNAEGYHRYVGNNSKFIIETMSIEPISFNRKDLEDFVPQLEKGVEKLLAEYYAKQKAEAKTT